MKQQYIGSTKMRGRWDFDYLIVVMVSAIALTLTPSQPNETLLSF